MSEVDHTRCGGCGAHYTQAHAPDCAWLLDLRAEADRVRALHLLQEEARGALIHPGEDGTYVVDGDDPVVVSYNEGGHNSTSVPLGAVLQWVRCNRPELLVHNGGMKVTVKQLVHYTEEQRFVNLECTTQLEGSPSQGDAVDLSLPGEPEHSQPRGVVAMVCWTRTGVEVALQPLIVPEELLF